VPKIILIGAVSRLSIFRRFLPKRFHVQFADFISDQLDILEMFSSDEILCFCQVTSPTDDFLKPGQLSGLKKGWWWLGQLPLLIIIPSSRVM
jgi:hypothetical protein